MKKIVSLFMLAVILCGTVLAVASCSQAKYEVGVQSGTTGLSYLQGDPDQGFNGFANLECAVYGTGALAVQDMMNGNIDFVVIDNATAAELVTSYEGTKMIDIPLTKEDYGIAVNKADAQLLSDINRILGENRDEINAIFEKYANIGENDADKWTGETIPGGTKDASKNQLVVATNAAFPPYEFKKGDQYAGIDMEIAKLIADELGMELVIEHMDFAAVVSSVGKNGIDVALAAMTINDKRKQAVNFSDPYYEGAYQVVICKQDCTLFDDCTTSAEVVAKLGSLSK